MPDTATKPKNQTEQVKEALDPLDLEPRLERYAREGFAEVTRPRATAGAP